MYHGISVTVKPSKAAKPVVVARRIARRFGVFDFYIRSATPLGLAPPTSPRLRSAAFSKAGQFARDPSLELNLFHPAHRFGHLFGE
jgi:hypothetical protein